MADGDLERDVAATFAALARSDVFPDVELVTDRLRLRAYTPTDVDDHFAMMDHEPVRRWSNGPLPYTREHAVAWCTREAGRTRTEGTGITWAVVDAESGRFLGMAGLTETRWQARSTEVSALGAPWSIGQGFAQEALRTISRWVLVDQCFNRLQISAPVENRASRRVAEACGFVREGVLRNAGFTHGGQVDLVVYGLVPSDLAASDLAG